MVISLFRGHVGSVNSSSMGVTGPQVVSAGEDGTIRVWDTSDGSQMDQVLQSAFHRLDGVISIIGDIVINNSLFFRAVWPGK